MCSRRCAQAAHVVVDTFVVKGAIESGIKRHMCLPGYMVRNGLERIIEALQPCSCIIVIAKLAI
jgi:hypothetical protein